MRRLSGPLLLWSIAACGGGTEPGGTAGDTLGTILVVQVVAGGLVNPVYLTSPPGDPRLFVVEQPGRIRIIEEGGLRQTPFLDISGKVLSGGERGLLSLAFHPNYSVNGFFYVDYTDTQGDTKVERYQVSADRNRADPNSATLVLAVDQPFSNHNGGLVMFGPDGMLYVGLGDGGSGGDPFGHAQNLGTLLGSLLRIDVDAAVPYAVPQDNPFVKRPGARGEIWAYGLRNPWRFAFDREGGMLYIADVGQNRWEEINAVPIGAAGVNYGWNILEGSECFNAPSCNREGLTLPVHEYPRTGGACGVIGGFVYRGQQIPQVRGHYFYSDYCAGFLRSFRLVDGKAEDHREWNVGNLGQVLSFGEDSAGELYILSANGRVYRLAAF
ncbi:MAG: glucose dehydrogenase [Gemmatimonadales bacterium]|nr:MAG: glucose dehydrogenase [Gemmatimonadales bacterium]